MNYTKNRKIAQVKETTLVVGGGHRWPVSLLKSVDWRGIEASDCRRSLLDMRGLLP